MTARLCLLLLLSTLSTSALAQPTPDELAKDPVLFLTSARKSLKWDEPADPAHIAGPIYFVGTKGLAVYLVKTSAGHIVVHSGMPGSGPMIEASIKKLGLNPADIKILLCGHAHIDHAGGHAYLQKLSGAKIAMMKEEVELFESGGATDFHYGKIKEFQFDGAKVDTVLKDGDTIELGAVSILALRTSGHTRGSTTFVMKITVDDKPYSVVFSGSASVNPGYRLVKKPSYPGIAYDFLRTFRVMEKLQPDIWLHAHTEAFAYEAKLARAKKEGISAWVDPAGYRKMLQGAREKYDEVTNLQKQVEFK